MSKRKDFTWETSNLHFYLFMYKYCFVMYHGLKILIKKLNLKGKDRFSKDVGSLTFNSVHGIHILSISHTCQQTQ